MCANPLKPACGHCCTLLCHPGACPPCPQVVQASCFCGKNRSAKYVGNVTLLLLVASWLPSLTLPHHWRSGDVLVGTIHASNRATDRYLAAMCANNCATVACCELIGWRVDCTYHQQSPDGPCAECPQSRIQRCSCGKEESLQPCAIEYSCKSVCDVRLSCKKHTCTLVCHSGPCMGCPNDGDRFCPCGKKSTSFPIA